ncbi:MAG: MFS transporter [Rhodospirillaceae bacterium]
MTFWTLFRVAPRPIAFGMLYTTAAAVGQTMLISLFLPGIKASLGLGDADVAVIFTVATLASAAALWQVGTWIDTTDLMRYALSSATLLLLSCALVAASPVPAVFFAAMFCLRLAGNGLLNHVAITATARHFSAERGQALSIVLLGTSIAEGLLPAVLLPLIAAWGWRWTLVALGCFGFLLTLVGALVIRRDIAFRTAHPRVAAMPASAAPDSASSVPADRSYFLFAAPLFAGMWLCTTAAIFHQALIAEAKGFTFQWFAVSFVAFAIVRAPVSIVTGRIVDRIGSDILFCLHLLPFVLGTAALILVDTRWVVPFFWLCAGITGGIGAVVQSTVVAERVRREQLGRARSVLGAAGIVASAVAPSLYGYALAGGATMTAVLWSSVLFMLVATGLGIVAAKRRRSR